METPTSPTSSTSKEHLLTPLHSGLTCSLIPIASQNNRSYSAMPPITEMPTETSSEISHPSGHPNTIVMSMDDCGLRSEERITDIQWAFSTQGRSKNTSGPIQSNGSSIASMQTRQS